MEPRMNFVKEIFLCAAVIFAAAAVVSAQAETTTLPKPDDFSWFTGCWELSIPENDMTITEMWTKPAGGTLFGVSRTVAGGKTVSFEYVRMTFGDRGVKYIVRHPSHAQEVAFDLIEHTNGSAVFQNLENDFPQWIIYKRSKSGGLDARIEGAKDDPKKAMDIPMKRVKCE